MRSPFSFRGDMGRGEYLLVTALAMLAQHLVVWGTVIASRGPMAPPWWFWLHPLRWVLDATPLPPIAQLGVMITVLLSAWVLAAAAVRRARRCVDSLGLAPMAIVPVIQWITFAILLAMKTRPAPLLEADEQKLSKTTSVAVGVLVGAGMCLGAVAFSTLVLGLYGWGLFFLSPITIGAATAYAANRRVKIGWGATAGAVTLALSVGVLGLLGFALEGAICLLLASPLIAGLGLAGSVLGRAMALARLRRRTTLSAFALVPALMTLETAMPPQAGFDHVESIEVAASPAAVWDSIVHMGPIPDAPAAPFRWGLAYPMRGQILGEGVGAVREGVFSTGVAYERVTVWEPERRLDFIVLSDPPTMRELSPYDRVNAPHTQSYFRTRDARFVITPLGSGRTRLTLATRHDLDIAPVSYWSPIAKWATHANKVRVLRHFKAQAEAA